MDKVFYKEELVKLISENSELKDYVKQLEQQEERSRKKIEDLESKLSEKEKDYYFNLRNLQMEMVVLKNELENK